MYPEKPGEVPLPYGKTPLTRLSRWVRLVRCAWITAMFLATFALAAKILIVLAKANNIQDVWYTFLKAGAIFLVLYVLFMTEGMMMSAIQIRVHDKEKVQQFIKQKFSYHLYRMGSVITRFQNDYERFAVGRQFLSIISVVSLVYLVNSLDSAPGDHMRQYLSLVPAGTGRSMIHTAGHWFAACLRNGATTFLISTLLPCWACQLLAHFVVEDRGVAFLRLPLSRTIADMSVRISKVEAGWPTFWMVERLSGRKLLQAAEKISAGDEAIFSAAAAYQGFCVKKRLITITATESSTIVQDHCLYEFQSGSTQDLQHSVRVSMAPEVRLVGWEYEYPPGLRRAKEVQAAFSLAFSQATDEGRPEKERSTVPAEESGELVSQEQDPLHAAETETDVFEEFLFVTEIAFHVPLPRRAESAEAVGVKVTYQIDPLDLESAVPDQFFFEIGKPTQEIVFDVHQCPGSFIRTPNIGFQSAVELPFLGQPTWADSDRMVRKETDYGWSVELRYPPVGARVVLSLDARSDPGA